MFQPPVFLQVVEPGVTVFTTVFTSVNGSSILLVSVNVPLHVLFLPHFPVTHETMEWFQMLVEYMSP
jgi:hypothetical protein